MFSCVFFRFYFNCLLSVVRQMTICLSLLRLRQPAPLLYPTLELYPFDSALCLGNLVVTPAVTCRFVIHTCTWQSVCLVFVRSISFWIHVFASRCLFGTFSYSAFMNALPRLFNSVFYLIFLFSNSLHMYLLVFFFPFVSHIQHATNSGCHVLLSVKHTHTHKY